MNGKPFFDTNVLVYAVNPDDPRGESARQLLAAGGLVSVQVLNEFASVAHDKLHQPWDQVSEKLAAIRSLLAAVTPLTVEVHERALAIAQRYGYHLWDALIIAAALEAACGTLYSEDLQDGQQIEGLRIRNPFRRRE
jgi:predicted nucleic acid-binding protein